MNQLVVHEDLWRYRRRNFPNLIATEFGIAELRRGCIVFGAVNAQASGKALEGNLQSTLRRVEGALRSERWYVGVDYLGHF